MTTVMKLTIECEECGHKDGQGFKSFLSPDDARTIQAFEKVLAEIQLKASKHKCSKKQTNE